MFSALRAALLEGIQEPVLGIRIGAFFGFFPAEQCSAKSRSRLGPYEPKSVPPKDSHLKARWSFYGCTSFVLKSQRRPNHSLFYTPVRRAIQEKTQIFFYGLVGAPRLPSTRAPTRSAIL